MPLAQERQEAKVKLLKVTIQYKVALYRLEEKKRIIKQMEWINKRREQLKIIEFAKLYVEYKKRKQRCFDMLKKAKDLKRKENELREEVFLHIYLL